MTRPAGNVAFQVKVIDCDYCHDKLVPCATLGMEETTYMCGSCAFDLQWAVAQHKARIKIENEKLKEG